MLYAYLLHVLKLAAFCSNFWINFLITSWYHCQIIMGNGASTPRLGGEAKTEEVTPDWLRFDGIMLLL